MATIDVEVEGYFQRDEKIASPVVRRCNVGGCNVAPLSSKILL